MKLELKENMYVRTKDGYISQYKYYDTTNAYMEKLLCIPLSNGNFANIEDIVKASYNIIDILECGDYVNGSKVMKTHCKLEYIDDDSDTGVNEVDDGLELENGWIYFEYEVETIVTKEQFEKMAYKVGE